MPVHVLTGCDTVSALNGQGKVKVWHLVKSNPEAYSDILNLGHTTDIDLRTIQAVEKLFTDVYKRKNDGSPGGINALRYKLFC